MTFLARFAHGLWRVLDGLRRVLHLVLLVAIFVILIVASHPVQPTVPARAALVLRPEGQLVEQLSGSPLDRSFGALTSDREPETLVRDLTDAIGSAATDSRIRALVLDLNEMGGAGLSKLEAVATAIQGFRAHGKKVYAYARYASQGQYFLMAQADAAYLDPAGELGVVGFAAYRLYFREALDRLGVNVHVFRVGTHKSFTEPYTRSDMSPEDRQQTEALLGAMWRGYAAGVESGRGLPAGALAAYVDGAPALMRAAGGDAARIALERKLVTGLKSWPEFERELVAEVGEDSTSHHFNAIVHGDYLAATRAEPARHPGAQVAVLVAAGEIVDGDRPPGEIGGQSFAQLVRAARLDKDVKAVVLRIDSGGGSLVASEQIREEVEALRAAGKPVVASFASVAASGGYYIAMDSDEIFAEPATITGSIGVFGIVPTFERTLGKLGVASDGVATSALAGVTNLERNLDPAASDVLQQGVEHAYREFVAHVAAARHRPVEEIEKVAEGQVWIGTEAKRLGLVDTLGDATLAVAAAARRAHLAPGSYAVTFREKELNWRESLVRQLHAEGRALATLAGLDPPAPTALGRALGAAERELAVVAAFNDPRRLYYYCACEWR